jgi:periplasmic divalent cation tolerance protein
MSELRLIHSTFDSRDSAARMAEELVERKLAACVSIGSGVKSYYRWEGELHADQEVPMFVKTREPLVQKTLTLIEENHPYDCPELLVTPVEEASIDYENWVTEQTQDSNG